MLERIHYPHLATTLSNLGRETLKRNKLPTKASAALTGVSNDRTLCPPEMPFLCAQDLHPLRLPWLHQITKYWQRVTPFNAELLLPLPLLATMA